MPPPGPAAMQVAASRPDAAHQSTNRPLIRAEKRSGTTTEGREELRTVLDFLRKGDVLMVTRIDRLARSIGDLQDIVRTVRARSASLKATERPIDTGTAAGKCFLDMLGAFAEFETNLRRERPHRQSLGGHHTSLCESQKEDLARLRLPTTFPESPHQQGGRLRSD
jgi:DNA invertase Pin-like site-specific DNA recombinase